MTPAIEVALADLNREQLNEKATKAGVEDAAKLKSKGAVIEAIVAAEATAEKATNEKQPPDPPATQAATEVDKDKPYPGEQRIIEKVEPRGDWVDPFCGKLIYYGDEVSPVTGAVKSKVDADGDEVLVATYPEG